MKFIHLMIIMKRLIKEKKLYYIPMYVYVQTIIYVKITMIEILGEKKGKKETKTTLRCVDVS